MSSKNQGKLLRAFEDKKYRRIEVDLLKNRFSSYLFSSDFSLDYLKREKILRNDLIRKLNFYEIYVPSLSERNNDKLDLVNEFINEIVEEKRINLKNISKDFLSFIMNIECFKNTLQLKNSLSGVYQCYVITIRIKLLRRI